MGRSMGKKKGRGGARPHRTCPSFKDKLKEGGQRDSTEEGTVACSVVARAFD